MHLETESLDFKNESFKRFSFAFPTTETKLVFSFSQKTRLLTGMALSSKNQRIEKVFRCIRFVYQKYVLKRKKEDIDPTF